MKKLTFLFTLLFSSILCLLYHMETSFTPFFVSDVEALTDNPDVKGYDDVTADFTVQGKRHIYSDGLGYQNTEWRVCTAVINGEIVVGSVKPTYYDTFYCCGPGYDGCHPFTPSEDAYKDKRNGRMDPWLCKVYEKGVQWWNGATK